MHTLMCDVCKELIDLLSLHTYGKYKCKFKTQNLHNNQTSSVVMSQKKVLKHMQKRKWAVMMMMMMIPQKNLQSSPKKRLKHMGKKKICGDDDDGTECSFLQTSDGTGH
jgi:hypothetical protein